MSWFGPTSILGECPRWDGETQQLSWVDIDSGVLHRARPSADGWTTTESSVEPPLSGAALLDSTDADRWLVAVGGSLAEWTPVAGLTSTRIVEPGSPTCPVRLNELVTDPSGRVWVGSMAYDWTPGAGSFFRVEVSGHVDRVLDNVTIANGLGWSPDGGTMYTTDTGPGQITAWDHDPESGQIARPRVLAAAEPEGGKPDGLAVDVSGNVWSAFAGGFRVSCFDPSGREIERVQVPAPNPTSCCFAGPGLDRLVVTTGRKRLPADVLRRFPDSGRMWDAGPVGVRGLPQHRARVCLHESQEVSRSGR